MSENEARNELVLWRNRNSDNGYHYKFVEALTIAIKAIKKIEKLKSILKDDEEYDCYTKHFLIQELEL